MIHAGLCSSIWFKLNGARHVSCIICFDGTLALLRFIQTCRFLLWILLLWKSLATFYISNWVLYKKDLFFDRNPSAVSPETFTVSKWTAVCLLNYSNRPGKTGSLQMGIKTKKRDRWNCFYGGRAKCKRSIVMIGLNIMVKPFRFYIQVVNTAQDRFQIGTFTVSLTTFEWLPKVSH